VTLARDYQQIAGLFELRTTFSDGAYDLQFLVQLAKKRSFGALFINDHDRMVIQYGLPPFRNIFKKRIELNSINKTGMEHYVNSIGEIEKKRPGMITIPGSKPPPFYYWTGPYLKKNLTTYNHERWILTIGLVKAEDYRDLPIIHNNFSTTWAWKGCFQSYFCYLLVIKHVLWIIYFLFAFFSDSA
jgi:hypothetical protein